MIMVILLSIVLGMSGILLGQLKTMKGIENSVIAFYAADTGIERVLMERENPMFLNESFEEFSNGARYDIEVKDSDDPDCGAVNYCISSVGTYRETQRAIQVSY